MLDFFAAIMIITGGVITICFWLFLIGAIAVELTDRTRESKAVLEEE